MLKYLVYVTHTNNQTRISIPKVMAREIGLDETKMAVLETGENRTIKIKAWENGKYEQSDIQKN